MKNISVLGAHMGEDENFGVERGYNPFGGLIIEAEKYARQMLEEKEFSFHSQKELPPENADIILCVDLTPELDLRIRQCHGTSHKILLCEEAPLHSSYTLQQPHNTFLQPMWEKTITWNRSYEAEHIIHYDIPFVFGQAPKPPSNTDKRIGMALVSNATDEKKGLIYRKNHLCQALNKTGLVELMRHGEEAAQELASPLWLKYLIEQPFVLAIEDTWVSGYVSELLPACIVAGVPAIYWGDQATAQRRFPGTFIPLEEMSIEAFHNARLELDDRKNELYRSIKQCQDKIKDWSSSFVNTVVKTISLFKE